MAEEQEIKPELSSLRECRIRYEIAAQSERQERDREVACWRDVIHSALKQTPTDYKLIHQVLDAMDNFLNHAGGRRK